MTLFVAYRPIRDWNNKEGSAFNSTSARYDQFNVMSAANPSDPHFNPVRTMCHLMAMQTVSRLLTGTARRSWSNSRSSSRKAW